MVIVKGQGKRSVVSIEEWKEIYIEGGRDRGEAKSTAEAGQSW